LAAEPDKTALSAGHDEGLADKDLPEIVRKIRTRTPARLLHGRAGTSYCTSTQIELREAHANARDAVRAELDLGRDFEASLIGQWSLFEVRTQAANKDEFLLRPDLGRSFSAESRAEILRRCPGRCDLQIVVGDGLSVSAVRAQVPELLPLLSSGALSRGWTVGQSFVVRHCRVGILNEIGELLAPKVAILLIGERPGLATAESLSAYMGYQPNQSHTDADRNLISNIHARGVSTQDATTRIMTLSAQMMATRKSGYMLHDEPFGLTEA
jgi:ethanolamine ammonia-lyase small subunit